MSQREKAKRTEKLKKWMMGAVMLALVLALSGCGSQTAEPAPQSETSSAEEAAVTSPEAAPASSVEASDRESVVAKLSSMSLPEEMSYEMTFSSQGYNATTRIWMKGEKSRMEGSNDMEGSYISIEDGEYTYMLDPEDMTGIKMYFDDEDDFFEDDFDDDYMDGDYDWGNMEFLGTETINGIRTYVFKDDDDYEKVKVWIHADNGFPVRIEGEEDGETYVMEITNFKIGGVSDSMFQVPAGYEIMEMNW